MKGQENARINAAQYAVLAAMSLIGGVIVLAEGQTGFGLLILACAVGLAVLAAVRWRQRIP